MAVCGDVVGHCRGKKISAVYQDGANIIDLVTTLVVSVGAADQVRTQCFPLHTTNFSPSLIEGVKNYFFEKSGLDEKFQMALSC